MSVEVADISSQGFGGEKEMSPDRIKSRLIREPYLILAKRNNATIGFQFQNIFEKEYQGKAVVQQLLKHTEHYFHSIGLDRTHGDALFYCGVLSS